MTRCTLHDYFVACPNGGFFDYQLQQRCELIPMSQACITHNCDSRSYSHKLWRVARQFVQQSAGLAPSEIDGFIAISRLSRDILRPYLPRHERLFGAETPRRAGRVDMHASGESAADFDPLPGAA